MLPLHFSQQRSCSLFGVNCWQRLWMPYGPAVWPHTQTVGWNGIHWIQRTKWIIVYFRNCVLWYKSLIPVNTTSNTSTHRIVTSSNDYFVSRVQHCLVKQCGHIVCWECFTTVKLSLPGSHQKLLFSRSHMSHWESGRRAFSSWMMYLQCYGIIWLSLHWLNLGK